MSGKTLGVLVLMLGLGGVVLWGLRSGERDASPELAAARAPSRASAEVVPGGPEAAVAVPQAPRVVPQPAGEPVLATEALAAPETPPMPEAPLLRSGEIFEIEAAALPRTGPVVLNLALGEPSGSSDPLSVRVVGTDGRQLQTRGVVDAAQSSSARVEIGAEWLSPGRYLVEVKTTERSHMPLRRYALVVR